MSPSHRNSAERNKGVSPCLPACCQRQISSFSFPSVQEMVLPTMGCVCLYQLIIKAISTYLLICQHDLGNFLIKTLLRVVLGCFNPPPFCLILSISSSSSMISVSLHSLSSSWPLISANRLESILEWNKWSNSNRNNSCRTHGRRTLFADYLTVTCSANFLVQPRQPA